jgi:hypothetical protein
VVARDQPGKRDVSKPAAFTQTDIARLLKGAKQAGETVRRIEIDRAGNIVAEFGTREDDGASEDEWSRAIRAKRERTAAKRH